MYKVKSTEKTRTLLSTTKTTLSVNNGLSFMLMKTKKNQRKENSTKTSVCTLRGISSLKVRWPVRDTLTFLETTLSSRLQMVMTLRNGTLTNHPRPSNQLVNLTCLGISKAQESQPTYKYGRQTLHGGKSSSTKERPSLTLQMERFLMSQKERTMKARMLLSGTEITVLTKDGQSGTLTLSRMNQQVK